MDSTDVSKADVVIWVLKRVYEVLVYHCPEKMHRAATSTSGEKTASHCKMVVKPVRVYCVHSTFRKNTLQVHAFAGMQYNTVTTTEECYHTVHTTGYS